jgi:hypothetical protein
MVVPCEPDELNLGRNAARTNLLHILEERGKNPMKRLSSGPVSLMQFLRGTLVAFCVAMLTPGDLTLLADVSQQQDSAAQEAQVKIPNDQLDSLVAPIALYPDPMLAQVLAASTYPLEIIQLQQFLSKNPSLKDKALEEAVMKQNWDPSVQGLSPMPDVVKRLADDIQWTTDLGNAFLAQQSDVMDAVQRMRAKAQGNGNLKSSEQMKVETKVVESKQVIVIEQSNPQVVYVPSYNPTVVYGPPVYPYPPVAYPPPGYYAAGMALSFGVGLAMGAAWGGGWGYNSNWGGNNNVTINNNNNYNRNSNANVNRSSNRSNNWQHNSQHRGGTPYSNRSTANKYGGTTRGASATDRQASARQQQGRQQRNGQAGTADRGGIGGGRQQTGTADRGGAGGGRQQAGGGNRAPGGGGAGGGDRIGNRSVPSGGSSRGSGGFSGGAGGYSGSSARSSSARGASSMGGGGSRGGGSSRGGGGRRR